MLYNLWRLIQLWLPYWVILQLYKRNKALPFNIKTRTGKLLKAIMVSAQYGIIFTQEDYTKNRLEVLQARKDAINKANQDLVKELNELSFEAKEKLVEGEF